MVKDQLSNQRRQMRQDIEKYIVLLSRIILGGVFIYASLDKIANPAEFAKAVGNYHVLPFGVENLLALVLPWMELLVGLALILGVLIDGSSILVIFMNNNNKLTIKFEIFIKSPWNFFTYLSSFTYPKINIF